MLLFGGDLSRRDAIIDLSGGYAQQAGGFSNRDALTVSLVRAGNSMLVTDPSDTGISEVFSFRGGQAVLVQTIVAQLSRQKSKIFIMN